MIVHKQTCWLTSILHLLNMIEIDVKDRTLMTFDQHVVISTLTYSNLKVLRRKIICQKSNFINTEQIPLLNFAFLHNLINCQQTSIDVNYIQQILIGYVLSYLVLNLKPRLHRYIFKSFRCHFIAFSNPRSTLDSVSKCFCIYDQFHRFHVNRR